MSKDNIRIKNYCSRCDCDTNHTILHEVNESNRGGDEFSFIEKFQIVRCLGCDNISFRREYIDEDFLPDRDDELHPDIDTYPISKKENAKIGISYEYTYSLPRKIYGIYKETVDALNCECLILAAAGFRALVEAICMEQEVTGRVLDTKINKLLSLGHISKKDRDRLHAIRFLGNDSLHEIATPKKNQLLLVFEIVTNLLDSLYILEAKTHGHLQMPIKDYNEFLIVLDKCIENKSSGTVETLKNMLPLDKKLVKEDMEKFEKQLNEDIQSGVYTKLRIVDLASKEKKYEVI